MRAEAALPARDHQQRRKGRLPVSHDRVFAAVFERTEGGLRVGESDADPIRSADAE